MGNNASRSRKKENRRERGRNEISMKGESVMKPELGRSYWYEETVVLCTENKKTQRRTKARQETRGEYRGERHDCTLLG